MARTAEQLGRPPGGPEAAIPLLLVEAVRGGYGDLEVLHGIDLDVKSGEAVAVLGANGAGKTTLLRCISRLLDFDGTVTIAGTSVRELEAHQVAKLGVSHVPEGGGVFHNLSVQENLHLGSLLAGEGKGKDHISFVYELFPILHQKRVDRAGSLSGGQQRMLAIGRALMTSPKLLLLDEPSQGLAPVIIKQLTESLRRVHAQGTTMVLVEQSVAMALKVCERGYVLENGNVVLDASSDQLQKNDRVREAYLGA